MNENIENINNKNILNLKNIIISSLICLIPAIIAFIIWDKLPDEMPTSFNFNGEVTEYMSKFKATIGVSIFLLFFHIIMILTITFDPLKNNNSNKIKSKLMYFVPILSNVVIGMVIAYSLNFNIDITRIISLFLSAMFTIMGNFLPKCKKNYTIGVKTPWTFHSEDNWYYTHRISGKIWFYTGIIGVINALTLNSILIFLIVILVISFGPIWVSFNYYRTQEQNRLED